MQCWPYGLVEDFVVGEKPDHGFSPDQDSSGKNSQSSPPPKAKKPRQILRKVPLQSTFEIRLAIGRMLQRNIRKIQSGDFYDLSGELWTAGVKAASKELKSKQKS